MYPKENLFGRSISPASKLVFPLSSKLLPFLEDPSYFQDDSPIKEWLKQNDNSIEENAIDDTMMYKILQRPGRNIKTPLSKVLSEGDNTSNNHKVDLKFLSMKKIDNLSNQFFSPKHMKHFKPIERKHKRIDERRINSPKSFMCRRKMNQTKNTSNDDISFSSVFI